MLNLCDPFKFKSLLDWDGSAINVQHLKLDLVSHNMLQRLKKEYEKPKEVNSKATTSARQQSEEVMETS